MGNLRIDNKIHYILVHTNSMYLYITDIYATNEANFRGEPKMQGVIENLEKLETKMQEDPSLAEFVVDVFNISERVKKHVQEGQYMYRENKLLRTDVARVMEKNWITIGQEMAYLHDKIFDKFNKERNNNEV